MLNLDKKQAFRKLITAANGAGMIPVLPDVHAFDFVSVLYWFEYQMSAERRLQRGFGWSLQS
jgi:hypothetical protein